MKTFNNLFISIFLTACSITSVYGQKTIKLDPALMLKGNLQLSDIAESVEYIPLETCDNCFRQDWSYE
jgi:hypothetical protein